METSSEQEKWELPNAFQLTPERLKANDERQAEWAKQESAAPQTIDERDRQRARLILSSFINIDLLTQPPAVRAEISEALATVGRYDEAAVVEPNASLAADYRDIWAALQRPDAEWCVHPLSARYSERDVFNVRDQSEAVLYRCNTCGFRNIAPVDALLQDQRTRRFVHRAAYTGTHPQTVKNTEKR